MMCLALRACGFIEMSLESVSFWVLIEVQKTVHVLKSLLIQVIMKKVSSYFDPNPVDDDIDSRTEDGRYKVLSSRWFIVMLMHNSLSVLQNPLRCHWFEFWFFWLGFVLGATGLHAIARKWVYFHHFRTMAHFTTMVPLVKTKCYKFWYNLIIEFVINNVHSHSSAPRRNSGAMPWRFSFATAINGLDKHNVSPDRTH